MTANSDNTKVRLIAQGKDLWRVQVLLTSAEITRIPERLREIKSELAAGFGVHDDLLEYLQLLSKKKTRNGILVEMQIRKLPLVADAPKFRFLQDQAEDGTAFSEMILEADLFPRDQFERPLNRERIESLLTQEGIDLACVDWGAINEILQEFSEHPQPILCQTIGRGTLPEFGKHSKITYAISDSTAGLIPTAWIGVHWCNEGDLILEASTATSGLKSGKNIFGRELQPRRGIQTRLEAGDGVELAATVNQLRAKREGLITFARTFSDRRTKDDSQAIAAKLRAVVSAVKPETKPQVFKTTYEYPSAIFADVQAGSNITARNHLLIRGNIQAGSQIHCSGSLRIIGNVVSASLTVHGHLAIIGSIENSEIHCDLTSQVEGEIKDCILYAREIIAANINGGIAEALIHNSKNQMNASDSIQINHRKFLENQQAASVAAVADLREQLALVNELFGPEVTQQVTPDTVQLMLLRWLRRQKALGVGSYSFHDVQEFRTILSMVPLIREQLAAAGAELRDVTTKLDVEEPASATV